VSNFICEECGAKVVDSPRGYITGCEHYPVETVEEVAPKRGRHIVLDLSDDTAVKEKFGG
jgi:hypothetical protein